MRTRAADDFDHIRQRLEELQGKNPAPEEKPLENWEKECNQAALDTLSLQHFRDWSPLTKDCSQLALNYIDQGLTMEEWLAWQQTVWEQMRGQAAKEPDFVITAEMVKRIGLGDYAYGWTIISEWVIKESEPYDNIAGIATLDDLNA